MRGSLLGVLLTCTVAGVNAHAADRPNIVFVLFDDMGYGEPACYRAESGYRTPSLDRLAKEGLRFTDAHSAASVCTPTRYGLLTGRYPSRIGQFGVLTTYSKPIIPPTRLTVAGLLKSHGYFTGCIGKWHLGLRWEGQPGTEKSIPAGAAFEDGPLSLGFDTFEGFTHSRNIGTVLSGDRVGSNQEAVEVQPFLAQRATAWLEERATKRDQPFFLYLPLCPPHTPIVPAPEFAGQSGVQGKPEDVAYADWLYEGDWVLGQVLESLDRLQLTDKTLVIATSDNGAAGRPYPPLRGSKSSIYEGGHRVPFLARWPGQTAAGTVCDATICHNDLLATCAELLGVELPPDAGEDSVSFLPLLRGGTGPVRESTLHQSPGRDLALRQGDWKLILHADGRTALYNLGTDLGETREVAASNPDVVARMKKRLEELVRNGRTTPGPNQTNDVKLQLPGTEGAPVKGRGRKKSAAERNACGS